MSKTLVTLIGVGNRNVGDDGIALTILEDIAEINAGTLDDYWSYDIDILLWETKDALSIAAELMEIHTPVVIVDCADMGLDAGAYRWFKQSECHIEKHLGSVSTHGFGFAEALELAQELGFNQEIYFFAIQPEQLDMNRGISPILLNKIDLYCNLLLEQLQKIKLQSGWG